MSASLRGASSRIRSYGSFAMESSVARTRESERSWASAVKAIHFPSGDTATSECEYAVLVSDVRLVSPFLWIKICVGRLPAAPPRPPRPPPGTPLETMKPAPFAL